MIMVMAAKIEKKKVKKKELERIKVISSRRCMELINGGSEREFGSSQPRDCRGLEKKEECHGETSSKLMQNLIIAYPKYPFQTILLKPFYYLS